VKPLYAALAFSAVLPAQSNPFHGNKDAIEAGRGMFRIYCSPCHGIGATGGRGPDLTLGKYNAGDDDAALFKVIVDGAQGTEMPSFSERFDSSATWRLVAYIRSVAGRPAPKVTGNAVTGEKLFWSKGGCGACHRIAQRGCRMGPDLTNVGRLRSFSYLEEALTEPDKALTPGYNTVIVIKKDGSKVTGVQRGYDAFSAQLIDVSETFHSYFRDDVRSITREFKSIMPSYKDKLSRTETDDILAFLVGLGRETGERK
jgi:putative heme-binding domain-containing protein